jgi:predicted NBD/HSP70 family sugar kinase
MPGITFTTSGALDKAALREANERLVLNTIRQNPSISRADIVRATGLAASSVTYIVGRLSRNNLLIEEESNGQDQVGRRPTALRLRPDSRMVVGVEILLPESRIVLADFNGDIVRTKTVRWHPNNDVFLARVHSAIQTFVEPLGAERVLGVGVGLPGTIDRTSGRVIAAENFNWMGLEVGRVLRGQLPVPFSYENSAKLAALSEMWSSEREGKPLRDFVFVMGRGGLGTGVIVNGQVFQGAHCAGAEFGHTMLYADGRRCSCGNTGCWEQYASDIALCRLYNELREEEKKTAKADIEPGAILQLAREGDPLAHRAVQETARHLGLGLVNLIWALDPEAVIVGDWMAESWDLLEETVWSVVRSRIAGYYLSGLKIAPSKHSADCTLLGAVALVLSRFFSSFDNGKTKKRWHSTMMQPTSQQPAGAAAE